jgi:uncharacterized protein
LRIYVPTKKLATFNKCRYIKWVCVEFDPAKDATNIAKHGLSLAEFQGFDAEPDVATDDRYDYGEIRFQARGRINGVAHCIVYTETAVGIRLISFRRAHEKEMRRYGK